MAPPDKIEGSWGIDPVPARLRVLSGLDTGLLWGNLGASLVVIVAGAALVPALSLPDALVALVLGCLVGNLMLHPRSYFSFSSRRRRPREDW